MTKLADVYVSLKGATKEDVQKVATAFANLVDEEYTLEEGDLEYDIMLFDPLNGIFGEPVNFGSIKDDYTLEDLQKEGENTFMTPQQVIAEFNI